MRAAVIGLPQSGKSTLFAAATGLSLDPGQMLQEHVGVVSVPDERLEFLTRFYKPKKTTHATVEFVDVPGFSLADRHGVGELKRHLPTIRQAEVLVGVIRDFENASVPAYRDRVDPKADLKEIWEELVFADLDTVTTRLERLEKALQKPGKNHDAEKREHDILDRCRQSLEESRPLSAVLHVDEDRRLLSSFAFLTQKPWVVVFNVDESRAAASGPEVPDHARAAIALCAETEAEIAQLDESDRPAFLKDLGVTEPARDRLVHACFDAMGLITFFTGGDREVRAWTLRRGATALEAADRIHSDLARGFIRAETVHCDDLRAAGNMNAARAAGKVRQEGKGYAVQDGDVIFIKFSV